jgi:lipopolysaccharide/colanic/teichoic acid biosynthesis glycosyltransferase
MKRIFDFAIALISLIILSPFLVLIGILIKLNGYGPVLFKQMRVGKDGKLFRLYKLCTMRVSKSSEQGSFEPGDLSRITRTGRILRKAKIDELPQLINVLKGDMSLVGPRPEVEKWIAAYPERWKLVLTVKPGITDNSSVVFRNEEYHLAESDNPEKTYKDVILPKKLDLYTDYVLNNSFYGDLKILFKTLYSVLFK